MPDAVAVPQRSSSDQRDALALVDGLPADEAEGEAGYSL
jgi:hypothetical protein